MSIQETKTVTPISLNWGMSGGELVCKEGNFGVYVNSDVFNKLQHLHSSYPIEITLDYNNYSPMIIDMKEI